MILDLRLKLGKGLTAVVGEGFVDFQFEMPGVNDEALDGFVESLELPEVYATQLGADIRKLLVAREIAKAMIL